MKGKQRALALALAAVLLAASLVALRGEPGAELIDAFRADAGVTFTDCADDACLEAAEARCTPAHLARTLHLTDGTPVKVDDFVLPQPEGCRVVQFADYTKDAWGGCVVRRQSCPSLAALRGGDPLHHGCGASEVLFTDPGCEPH